MKKFLITLILICLTSSAYADKMTKNGFLSNKVNYSKDQKITNPENKILLIYNHGQSSHDGPSSDCVWKGGMKNMASLVGQKVKNKEILVYIFCTGKLKGDDYKRLWNKKKFKAPYKGKPKLEKRLEENLKLIENFASQGFKKNQIFITGRSCGGWMTMMLMARYPEKVGAGISLMQACYGEISKKDKIAKIGVEKGLEKFKKQIEKKVGKKDLILIEKNKNERSIGKGQNFFNAIFNEKIKEGEIISCEYIGIKDEVLIAKRI